MGSPLSSDEGEEKGFGATGSADDGEKTSIRVSRDMKRKLEISKAETSFTSMADMIEKMTYDNLTDISNNVKDSRYIVDFVNDYEDEIVDMDMEQATFTFNKSVTKFGPLNHYINFMVYDRYSGSIQNITTALDCERSDIVRICIIKDITERILDGKIDLGENHNHDFIEKWHNIQRWLSSFETRLIDVMWREFVYNRDGIEWLLERDPYSRRRLENSYREFGEMVDMDRIIDIVGNEPFNNLEQILEETK